MLASTMIGVLLATEMEMAPTWSVAPKGVNWKPVDVLDRPVPPRGENGGVNAGAAEHAPVAGLAANIVMDTPVALIVTQTVRL